MGGRGTVWCPRCQENGP
ncbi:zinc finger domain-containing protein [Streptomyces sp. NPDC048751]